MFFSILWPQQHYAKISLPSWSRFLKNTWNRSQNFSGHFQLLKNPPCLKCLSNTHSRAFPRPSPALGSRKSGVVLPMPKLRASAANISSFLFAAQVGIEPSNKDVPTSCLASHQREGMSCKQQPLSLWEVSSVTPPMPAHRNEVGEGWWVISSRADSWPFSHKAFLFWGQKKERWR